MDVAFIARISGGEHEIATASGDLDSVGSSVRELLEHSRHVLQHRPRQPPASGHRGREERPPGGRHGRQSRGEQWLLRRRAPRVVGGALYVTLCCLSRNVGSDLGDRDVQYMTVIADVIGEHLDAVERARRARREAVDRIQEVLGHDDSLQTVFQPIVDLADGVAVGFEALSRFPKPPPRPPNEWFAEAADAGLGTALERHLFLPRKSHR